MTDGECGSELAPRGPGLHMAPKSETEVNEPGGSGMKNVGHGLNEIRTPRWAGAGIGGQCTQKKRLVFVHSWLESRRDSDHREF